MGATTREKEHSMSTLISFWKQEIPKQTQKRGHRERVKDHLNTTAQEPHLKTEHISDRLTMDHCYLVFLGERKKSTHLLL